MSKRSPSKLLQDMIGYARSGVKFVGDMSSEEFEADQKTYLAVTRAVEIVGEAAKGLPEGFRAAHPNIPWRKITGTRDILAHGYDIIEPSRLWDVARNDLPKLIDDLTAILESLESQSSD